MRAEKPYPVDEYLNDVFAQIWMPLNGKDERQNDYRRQEQRAYVDLMGGILNPSQEKGVSNVANVRSDAILYVEQHLDQVENYLKAQTDDGLNGRHYHNLLLRIKKIREKYESGKWWKLKMKS